MDSGYDASVESGHGGPITSDSEDSVQRPHSPKPYHAPLKNKQTHDDHNNGESTDRELSEIDLDLDSRSCSSLPTAWEKAEEDRRVRRLRVSSWLDSEFFAASCPAPGAVVPWRSQPLMREHVTRLMSGWDQMALRRAGPRLFMGIPPLSANHGTGATIPGTPWTILAGVGSSLGSDYQPSSLAASKEVDSPEAIQRMGVHESRPCNDSLDTIRVGRNLSVPPFPQGHTPGHSTAPEGLTSWGAIRTPVRPTVPTSAEPPKNAVATKRSSLHGIEGTHRALGEFNDGATREPERRPRYAPGPKRHASVALWHSVDGRESIPRKRLKRSHDHLNDSQDDQLGATSLRKRVGPGSRGVDCSITNNPTSTLEVAQVAASTAGPIGLLEGTQSHGQELCREQQHSTYQAGQLSDQDFVPWREYCWFYAHNQEAYSSPVWASCRRPKNAISHITRHAEDVHGLSRGQGLEFPQQVFLARCARNRLSIPGNAPCDVCKSVAAWSTAQLEDRTHEGAAVCLRCYNIIATKKELFTHLGQGSLCAPRQMKLSREAKARILHTAFCSATKPPSGCPPPAPPSTTAQGPMISSKAMDAGNSTGAVHCADNGAVPAPLTARVWDGMLESPLPVPNLHPQPQDLTDAEISLLVAHTWAFPDNSVPAIDSVSWQQMAGGTSSIDSAVRLQTQLAGAGPALGQPSAAFPVNQVTPPAWEAACIGTDLSLADEGYGTLRSFRPAFQDHNHNTPQPARSHHTPQGIPNAPLTDMVEFGYGETFGLDIYLAGDQNMEQNGVVDGGLSYGLQLEELFGEEQGNNEHDVQNL